VSTWIPWFYCRVDHCFLSFSVEIPLFYFIQGTLSKRALGRRGSGFPCFFQQLWGVCVVTRLFRSLRRLFSLVRLSHRQMSFGGFGLLSFESQSFFSQVFLDNLHGKVFSRFQNASLDPECWEKTLMRPTSYSGSFRLTSLSLLQTSSIDLTWPSESRELSFSLVVKRRVSK